MSDANVITLKTHLREIAQRSKIRTNEQLVEFANATAAALEEMDGVKADKSELDALKQELAAMKNGKVDKSEISALKQDVAEMMAIFKALGLRLDADGDLVQN